MNSVTSGEVVQVSGGPETAGPSPALLHLHDTMRVVAAGANKAADSQAAIDTQRQQLWDMIQRSASLQPGIKDTILDCGRLLDYMWYADSTATPPDTIMRTPEGALRIDPAFATNTTWYNITDRIDGLEALIRERSSNISFSMDLHEAATAFMRDTPTYRLFASFAFNTPENTEQPLANAAKAGRIAGVHAFAERNYPDVHPSIMRAIIAPQLSAIEEMTAPRKSETNTDDAAYTRAREFLTAQIERFAAKQNIGPVTDISPDGRNGTTICINGYRFDISHVFYPFFQRKASLEALASDSLFERYVYKLLGTARGQEPYTAQIDRLASESFPQALHPVLNTQYSLNGMQASLHYLKTPNDPASIRPNSTSRPRLPGVPPQAELAYTPLEQYKLLERQTRGTVTKAPPNDLAERVFIPTGESAASLPVFSLDQADLIVTLPVETEGISPAYRVPGYETIGYNPVTRELGFRYTPANDPYARCNTVLDDTQITAAADVARTAGIPALAAEIESYPDLTVSALVDIIRQYSEYHLPPQGHADTQRYVPRPREAFELESFVNKDTGKFTVQCDSVAAICRVFLRATNLGITGSEVGSRLRVQKGARISGLDHEQVSYLDNKTGTIHLLDATPFSPATAERPGIGSALRSLLGRKALGETVHGRKGVLAVLASVVTRQSTVPASPIAEGKARTWEAQTPPLPESPAVPERPADIPTALRHARNELIEQIGQSLSVNGHPLPESMVLSNLARRPATDLMRLTVEIAELATPSLGLTAANHGHIHERAQGLLTYITGLRTAPGDVRDPHNYRTRTALLNSLERTLTTIALLTS